MTPLITTFVFMTGIGAFAAVVLIAAARFLSVSTDPRVDAVLAALPGANCGACGYSGCAGAAAAVVRGEAGCGVCLIGKDAVCAAVAKVMGLEAKTTGRKIAFLCCGRNSAESGVRFTVATPGDCRAATMLYGGGKTCTGGCIGYGTCETVCPVNAISMENGLPVIAPARCTGCNLCVKICPKKILALVDDNPAAIAKKRCAEYCVMSDLKFEVNQEACVKCGVCFKNCPVEAIEWQKGSPAVIDKDKCIRCFTCMRVCPPKVIS